MEKLTRKDLEKWIDDVFSHENRRIKTQKEREERVTSNFKHLYQRAKELNKEVPDELSVIIWINEPVGSWFFEKYKEWL